MSTEREELAAIISAPRMHTNMSGDKHRATADAILAAGYRKPRTIGTDDFDDLLLLPLNSIVMGTDNPEKVFQKGPEGWRLFGTDMEYDVNSIELPVALLYAPEGTP